MAAGQSKGSADKAGSDKAGAEETEREASAESEDMDDLKRKFREALDRKKAQHANGNADGAQTTGKVHDAHGPASSRRSFRRKSGG
jgi:Family of unknown function (DUF5302)